MDQQFQELISCLGGGESSPQVCKCASPVMAAPEKIVDIAKVQDILGGNKSFFNNKFNWYLLIFVLVLVVLTVFAIIAIVQFARASSKKIAVKPGMPEDILGLLDPLPDDLREEAIKFYNHEFSTTLTPAQQAELKSKIMKWADSWVEYEETKKEDDMKRVRFPPEVFQRAVPQVSTISPISKIAPQVSTISTISQIPQTENALQEEKLPKESKKKLANLYATEDVEVSNDFGRISEKSVEVEERMKRRSEQDRLMSQQAGLPFSDEFEPKK
jgi:hypothetical protein